MKAWHLHLCLSHKYSTLIAHVQLHRELDRVCFVVCEFVTNFVCHATANAGHDKKKGGIASIFSHIFDFEIPCGVLFRSGQSTPLQFLRFLLR